MTADPRYRRQLIHGDKAAIFGMIGPSRSALPSLAARRKLGVGLKRMPIFSTSIPEDKIMWVKIGMHRWPVTAVWRVTLQGQFMHIEFDVGERLD